MKQSPEVSLQALHDTTQSLFISTITTNDCPNSSYAPYIMDDAGHFYIFISQLAQHTQDLQNNPKVSILLMEDEQKTPQILARKRATYYCDCRVVEKENPNYTALLDAFETSFGKIMKRLRTLPDFMLFKLEVQSGHFVQGFGKAYLITPDGLVLNTPRS
jgi:putative heme iron utilization protein